MVSQVVLYDACVLYPAPLRDFLLQLALTDLYRAKWSKCIHKEWTTAVLRNRPDLIEADIIKTCELMDKHVRDALVEGCEKHIPSFELPDSNDRHVLAAAIESSASLILTFNLKDFPKEILDKYKIEAQHPDEFITRLIDTAQAAVCDSARQCRARLQNPTFSVDRYLDNLKNQKLSKTVNQLRKFKKNI